MYVNPDANKREENAMQRRDTLRRPRGIAVAVATTVASLVAFAALGGVGLAQSGMGIAQYQYGKKVTICHKGKVTITVSVSALPAHMAHGDKVGTCAAVEAKKKAAKAKAEKAKAEAKQNQAAEEAKGNGKGGGGGNGKGKGKG
jgi:uncharacterized membrane protein YgcG